VFRAIPSTQTGAHIIAPTAPIVKQDHDIVPVSFRNLITEHPNLRPAVIDGILRKGEIVNFIADSKAGKSWMGGGLAWSVVTGTPWLSHDVTQGRVLIIDNELHPETLASRLESIRMKMMIDEEEYGDKLDVVALRGMSLDIHTMNLRLAAIKPDQYSLIVLDALYRAIPEGTSENDNAQMMAIYNKLDYYASIWGAAIVVIHHTSKGAQGDKKITDMGAGAGAINRAADSIVSIRQHEDPELSVLECKTRSFRAPEAVSIRFDWPLWTAVAKAAEVKKSGRQSKEDLEKADKADSDALLEKIPVAKPIQQNKLFEQFDFGVGKCKRLVGGLVRAEKIKIHRKRKAGGKRQLVFYSKTESDSASDSACNSGTT
jgi:hypothetical protein